MNNKMINIVLITVLVCVSAWSIYMQNWYILVANVCILSGVIIDERCTELLTKENANFKFIRKLKKTVPVLWTIGGIALIIWGYSRYLN